jgi:hypothetical protein
VETVVTRRIGLAATVLSEGREQRQRLGPDRDAVAQDGVIGIVDADAVGVEQKVELAAFGDLGEVSIEGEGHQAVAGHARHAPPGDVVAEVEEKRAEVHLPRHLGPP